MKVLIFGYGNPGRQDDILGISFISELEKWVCDAGLTNIAFDSDYQLNIEDSLQASEYDFLLFADATSDQPEPFRVKEVKPEISVAFTTHFLSPESVLALCKALYGKCPKAYMITIKGFKWEINMLPTTEALNNLTDAIEYIKPYIANPDKFLEIVER